MNKYVFVNGKSLSYLSDVECRRIKTLIESDIDIEHKYQIGRKVYDDIKALCDLVSEYHRKCLAYENEILIKQADAYNKGMEDGKMLEYRQIFGILS